MRASPSYNAAMAKTFDICIRGAGIVGTTLALLMARERLKVALVPAPGPEPDAQADVRAYALNAASRAVSQPSTFVKAAQLMTVSGWWRRI